MKNNSPPLFFLFFIVFTINSQKKSHVKTSILKSTITTVGSSSASISKNNYFITQSIGQSSAIGKVDLKSISVQQGYLNNYYIFKINNFIDTPIDEVLEFVISPNPFVNYIKIKFNKRTEHNIYVKIYDIHGRVHIHNKYLPTDEIVLPMSRFSIGPYLIQIESGKDLITKKIFKKE